MNFKTFDLNLLRVLDAMLTERNVTQAAGRIGLSQPAVSSAINRLRRMLDDPLFVREGKAMVPTPFAQSLEEPVRSALDGLELALGGGKPFDPARVNRTFRIFGTDYFSEMLMPKLVDRISQISPRVRLQLVDTNERSVVSQLSDGSLDFALAPPFETPEWVEWTPVFHSSSKAVVSRNNQRLKRQGIAEGEPIPLDLFCDMPHIIFSPIGSFVDWEDQVLAKLGRKRWVAMTLPGFYGVARTVAQSQMLAILPARFAMVLADQLGLSIHPMPFDSPPVGLYLLSHKRNAANAEHLWMRDTIAELLEPLDEIAHPLSE